MFRSLSPDSWQLPECAALSRALLATSIAAGVAAIAALLVLSLRHLPEGGVVSASLLLTAWAATAFSAARIALADRLVEWNSELLALVGAADDAAAVAAAAARVADLPVATACRAVAADAVAFLRDDTNAALIAAAVSLLVALALIVALRTVWFVWIPMLFYSTVYYFFPKQRIYLGVFAVMLVLANVRAAFSRATGERPASMASTYFAHLAAAPLAGSEEEAAAIAAAEAAATAAATPAVAAESAPKNPALRARAKRTQ
jgi:hypothetical protein